MGIRIETLGRLHAFDGTSELDWLHGQRLRAALITYIAVERTVSRATLATVFWPESDEENARHALRQNLYQVKQVLGEEWIDARVQELRVTDAVTTDVAEFEEALERGDPECAARLYAGPFLDGVHVADLKAWETWVDARRAHLAREFRRACREWVAACHARGDAIGAIAAAQHWIGPDPLDDEGQHALIAALATSGRRTDAFRQYEAYAKLLEAEGLEPLEETKALVEELGEGREVGEGGGVGVAAAGQLTTIAAPESEGERPLRQRPGFRLQSRRSRALLVLAVSVAVIVTATMSRGDSLDSSVYLVGADLDGVNAETTQSFVRSLDAALRRVPDVRAVDPTRVLALRESDGEPTGEGAWLRRARKSGAGRLLRITYVGANPPVFTGVLYDLTQRTERDHAAQPASPAHADVAAAAAGMVEHLFDIPQGAIGRAGSADDAAVRAFAAGMRAEQRWNLDAATAHYRQAIALDDAFARAHFRLAQILDWTGARESEWRPHVMRADAGTEALEPEEGLLAKALLAMADERYVDACELYTTILEASPFSFRAQFGLGNCHREDNGVVRDSTSPSGWSFRSSHNASVEAYERAFQLEPGLVFTFGRDVARLSMMLYSRPTQTREGFAIAPDTGEFAAFASLTASDTLAFVPYRRDDVRAGSAPDPPGMHPATERGRRRLLEIVERLVREYPDDPAAMIARAEALEAVQSLDDVSAEASALTWARRAGRVATRPADQLNAALVEVRVLLKLNRYRDARRSALHALDELAGAAGVSPEDIATLGALTGRASIVADAMERGASTLQQSSRLQGVPVQILRTRERLTGFAMLGAWPDTIAALAEELERQVSAYMAPALLDARWCALMSQPFDYAYPVLRRPIDASCWTGAPRREAQAALSEGDRARVIAVMDDLDQVRQDVPANGLAIDVAFTEAWLIVEAGDPSRAASRLDVSLGAIGMMDPARLRQPAQIAGLVRAMALRADLAAIEHDESTASRWAMAVAELWRDADAPSLRETASRMGALARAQ